MSDLNGAGDMTRGTTWLDRCRTFAIASLLSAPLFVFAGPTLRADPYPQSSPQPAAVTITVNGSPGPACTLPRAADGSVTPTCDLVSLAPGTYTIVMTATAPASCPSPTSPAVCVAGGSASSAPFALSLSGGLATSPVLRIQP